MSGRSNIGAYVALAIIVTGCGSAPKAAPSTQTPTPTATPTATLRPLPSPGPGANISFFGLAAVDDFLLRTSGVDNQGRPIYAQRFGQGFSLVIEARPGASRDPVGQVAFASDPEDPSVRPDLQVIVSHPLGDGSPEVCDNLPPDDIHGIPAVDPPDFSETQVISDAINDLGCRFNDGTGNPGARGPSDACTVFEDGIYRFVNPGSTVQFCARIAAAFSFPLGDTIVTARVRDTAGVVGLEKEIVVRIDPNLATRTPPPTVTATPAPSPEPGANVTFFGLASASDFLLQPVGVDGEERPVYEPALGRGFSIVIEGQPGSNRRPVGLLTFNHDPEDPSVRPDLQVLTSRPLGDGSLKVCDNTVEDLHGIPAVDPPSFDELQEISDAINDLACRFIDGAGNPTGRLEIEACTQFQDGLFRFVDPRSTVQFCARIADGFRFPEGDTVITARLRDTVGIIGPERQIVVRVPER